MNDTSALTQYGFTWGPMEVTRLGSYVPRKGQESRVVGVKTPRDQIEIYVSRTGTIRVWRKGKGELK